MPSACLFIRIFVKSPLVSRGRVILLKERGKREATMGELLARILWELRIEPHPCHKPLHQFYYLVLADDPDIVVDDPADIPPGMHFLLLRKGVDIIPLD